MKMHAAAKMLEEIGVLLELKGESPFKSRAYLNGARIVEMIGEGELKDLVEQDKLKDVKGIGAALNEKLKEYVLTGKLNYYEELKSGIPDGLIDMLKVPGLGPRKVRALHEMLEISSLAELEYACRENRLVNLKGYGPKSQQNILEGIEFLRRQQGRYFLNEALTLAEKLLREVEALPGLDRLSLAGSIRRCGETIKDIDLVASSDDPAKLARAFAGLAAVQEVIASGDTKVTVRLTEGISADLRVVDPRQYPYALHHFTGSREHNTALRGRAKSMGLKINEYGLFKGDEIIPCSSESEFFAALGLSYIPPELRENTGEIEAAEAGLLPDLVSPEDIKGIFHVHTTYSDGSDSLEEIVRGAQEAGYEYVGVSDHSQSAFYAGGLKADDLARQQEEIFALREKYAGVKIFCGVESDIRADGSLDYPDSVLEKLDFVIASVHSGLKMERGRMTERLKKALSHPSVTMLGHPTNRLLLGRDSSPLDLEAILRAALGHDVILELNANPARLDLDWRHLKKAGEMGLLISINPDAHDIAGLDDTRFGVAIARKGWLGKSAIFNSIGGDEMEQLLEKRKSRDRG